MPRSRPGPPDPRRRLGTLGEQAAAEFYERRGATVVDRNWRIARGELDLVVREGRALVFVEVKTRRSHRFGLPVEAITPAKAARLRRLAGAWLQAHPDTRAASLRLDIASVTFDGAGAPVVEIITVD
jgi:putative endonuclease